ncbi:MAG: cadherin-like domain-containing protein, partial [Anaerolineales bacterium]|nr:cadherin-like domain-containing protein [Anaerolineales bacterium]
DQIDYTPSLNWSGTDTFTYTVTDTDGDPSTATVTVTVTAVNDPPVAVDDSYNLDEDTSLTIAAPGVLGNDTDVDNVPGELTASWMSGPGNGSLTLNPNGSFTYTPDNNFSGTDTFTYEVCDPSSACSSTNVTIVVNPIPDPQVFISVSPSDVTLDPNDVITFDLLFGNRGPGTAYGIVISGAVTGDCTLLTPNPIITSGLMNEGDGLLTTADVQENASGGACTFTATITSTNGTTESDSAEINKSTSMWAPFSSRALASTGSEGTIEAAIAFLIPVAMLISPFVLSWLGKIKRTSRSS